MKQLFTKLLAELKANSLITENKETEYIKLFENYIRQEEAKNAKLAERKVSKILEIQDTKHANKLKSLVEAIDRDHSGKLSNIVQAIDSDHTKKLENLMESIDVDHTSKMKKLMEAMDANHGAKLDKLMKSYDADRSKKLQNVIKLYETKIARLKNANSKRIEEKVNSFIETFITESLPKKTVVNESRLNRLEKLFGNFKQALLVNDEYVQTEIKEAVLDAHDQLKKKEKQINEMLLEKIELNDKMKEFNCKTLLEKKLAGASPKLRGFLESRFDGVKSAKEIEEKFDDAVTAFNKDEARRRTRLVENQKATIKPKQVKIEEAVEHRTNGAEDLMTNYVRQIESNNF